MKRVAILGSPYHNVWPANFLILNLSEFYPEVKVNKASNFYQFLTIKETQ